MNRRKNPEIDYRHEPVKLKTGIMLIFVVLFVMSIESLAEYLFTWLGL